MDKNYVDRKTERRNKYDKKRKGKITKDHKNFKSIKLEDIEDFKNGSIPTIHTQE